MWVLDSFDTSCMALYYELNWCVFLEHMLLHTKEPRGPIRDHLPLILLLNPEVSVSKEQMELCVESQGSVANSIT